MADIPPGYHNLDVNMFAGSIQPRKHGREGRRNCVLLASTGNRRLRTDNITALKPKLGGEEIRASIIRSATITIVVPSPADFSPVIAPSQLTRYFTAVVTGEDVTRNKPDPEGIQMVLKRMEVHPSNVIMVGDSASDIQAGRNARVVTGAALWGSKAMRDLWGHIASQVRPDFEFQTVAELDRFLFPAPV